MAARLRAPAPAVRLGQAPVRLLAHRQALLAEQELEEREALLVVALGRNSQNNAWCTRARGRSISPKSAVQV
jgi:hypothetical protein